MASLAFNRTSPKASLQALLARMRANTFARNLGAMGAAQLAIRLSRLAATVVLSRLLLPHDYGLAAIVLTAYEIVALFTRNGISAKVVQASADEAPAVAETAHKMTWIVCLALVAIQVAAAYPVAWIYGEPQLALPIAAMGLIYFATPLTSIQGAFQQREGRLGRIAAASAVQVVTDNILTAALALLGYGLWAIILPKILVAPIWVAFVRYGHAWRPGRVALPAPLHGWRAIAKFSRNVLGVELLTTIQGNIDNVLVGFFLGLHALGIYYFAFNAGLGITIGLVSAAGVAVYPHFCEVRHQPEALKHRMAATRLTLAKILLPLILAQALLAPLYVPLVFGAKWREAIPVLMVICLSALARPFASITSQYLKAIGRPDIEFKWQLATTLLLTAGLAAAAQIGILAVALVLFAVQTIMLGSFAILAPHVARGGRKILPAHKSIRVISTISEFDDLQAAWTALWGKVPVAPASQSYQYCRVAWDQLSGNERAQLLVVTLWQGPALLAVLPLILWKDKAQRRLTALNSGATEYDPLLSCPDELTAEDLEVLLDAISAVADTIDIPFVASGTAWHMALARRGLSRKTESLPAPRVALGSQASFENYWNTRSSNLRSGTKRRCRRLEEMGQVELRYETAPEPRREAILWALAKKAAWLKTRHIENDFIAAPRFRNFLLAYSKTESEDSGLGVFTLRLNGTLIACKIGTYDRSCFEGFVTVYDPEYESVSPGVALLIENLKWCASNGRDYDFRIGDESYKANWATDTTMRVHHRFATTPRGAVILLLEAPLLRVMAFARRFRKFMALALSSPGEAAARLQKHLPGRKPAMENAA